MNILRKSFQGNKKGKKGGRSLGESRYQNIYMDSACNHCRTGKGNNKSLPRTLSLEYPKEKNFLAIEFIGIHSN